MSLQKDKLVTLPQRVCLREDVPDVGVVGAAERRRAFTAVLCAAFTVRLATTCKHTAMFLLALSSRT